MMARKLSKTSTLRGKEMRSLYVDGFQAMAHKTAYLKVFIVVPMHPHLLPYMNLSGEWLTLRLVCAEEKGDWPYLRKVAWHNPVS